MALVAGALAAWHYASLGLTLSHYDAKAHLVVARRILDGINPGWVQVGAVWLPLPHLLNMLPVQVDAWYRTGLSGVALSILSFATTAAALSRILLWATGSGVAALVGTAVFVANPDVLYLQSTPMTESLLMALVTLSVWFGIRALEDPAPFRLRAAGLAAAAACLTRYESWPVTAALLVLGAAMLLMRRVSWPEVARRTGAVAVYPAGAILAFLVLGRASTGAWFTASGFFVAENVATGLPGKALLSVWWGTHELTSYAAASLALAGFGVALWTGLRQPSRSLLPVVLALAAAAALPAYAFFAGHPFRIRYMIPLVPSVGLGLGLFVGLAAGRWRIVTVVLALAALATGPRPLSLSAPMVVEAQWDGPNRLARESVTAYLRAHWNREMVMASMGSLAHYMQELSAAGFEIRDFLHEGNGYIWDAALESPAAHVEWLLIEERAEGGDMLAQRARARPRFLDGFTRVAEGGGVALFRRQP